MSRACRHAIRLAALAWMLALILGLLAACGGGDCDDDADKSTQPPDCKAHPELCR